MARKRKREDDDATEDTSAEAGEVLSVATPTTDAQPVLATELVPDAGIVLAHEPSGITCSNSHSDGFGFCQRCKHCNKKVRPQNMGDPCPART